MEVWTFQPKPVGHLTLKSAHIAGNLIKHFSKSQMPGGLPGGGGVIAFGIDPDIISLHSASGKLPLYPLLSNDFITVLT